MTTSESHNLIGRQTLNENELNEVERLATICNSYEDLELKLAFGPSPVDSEQQTNSFLYYEGGALVGFCSLDYEELCGMVHPDHRRKGIGRALLDAAINEYRRRFISSILIICEEASRSGKAFVASTGATYGFAERHMELEADANWDRSASVDSRLRLYKAGLQDFDVVAGLTAASLGGTEQTAKRHIESDMQDPTQQFYIARLEQTPIATLKTLDMGTKIGIYAFGVLPEYRGRGLGKQTLTQAIKSLIAENWTRFALEVETENANAFGLYNSCGFKVTTTYGYYKLALLP